MSVFKWSILRLNSVTYFFLLFTMTSFLQEFFRKSDLNNSGDVDKAEFVNYLREHEQQLHIVFSSLDENQDGKKTLLRFLQRLGWLSWPRLRLKRLTVGNTKRNSWSWVLEWPLCRVCTASGWVRLVRFACCSLDFLVGKMLFGKMSRYFCVSKFVNFV